MIIGPEECHVEAIARKSEIVGIAAESRNGGLRREHQPNVSVFLVAIEMVLAARIKRHHVAAFATGRDALLLNTRLGFFAQSIGFAQ